MLLASILISDSNEVGEPALPPVVEENIRSFKHHHPGLPHRMFGREDILALLRERFSNEVLHAFNALKPYSYKADLARYCILHAFGGAYADLSYLFVRPLPFEGDRPVVFRDFMWSSPWDVSVGIIAAPPGHGSLAHAIELVCANVRCGYYGSTPLSPTGPALFGKALAATCEGGDLVSGFAVGIPRSTLRQTRPNVSLPQTKKIHCLTFGNEIVAIKRKRIGTSGLSDLGITSGNGYSELWQNRDIYSSDPPLE
jgi:hypothetical protein